MGHNYMYKLSIFFITFTAFSMNSQRDCPHMHGVTNTGMMF